MILTVTPNPCVDKTVFVEEIRVGTFMRSSKCTCIPGGKGTNVSRAVRVLGRETRAMVIVGGRPGEHVVDMISAQDGVEAIPVWVASQTRTITTVLETKEHRQTAFFEPGSRVTEDEYLKFRAIFQRALKEARVVTFNGTVPDPAIRHLHKECIMLAKASGAITILDTHGPELVQGLEAAPFMAKPNIAESEELMGRSLTTESSKWDAVSYYHSRGVSLVVLSLGKDGALVSCGEEKFHVIPPSIQEVNPVGSGDALVAGFAIGLMEGIPLQDTARLATAAGTANAMSWDIGHFTREQVEELVPKVQIHG